MLTSYQLKARFYLVSNCNKTTHYHGTPVWGNKGEVLKVAVRGAGAFVSYARPDQINQCLKWADSLGLDNGAFSAWKRGLVIDWFKEFYPWLMKYYFHDKVKMFMIPDVIDGTEEENNELIRSVPVMFKEKAVPVWHLHESLDKLNWLCSEYERVAFGSSGEYATIRSKEWKIRMNQAFEMMCIFNHETKIHGLRMLDGRVLGNYPLHSADSTNLACNVPKYKVKYPENGGHILSRVPFTKEDKHELLLYRCAVLKGAVESVNPPTLEQWRNNNKFFTQK